MMRCPICGRPVSNETELLACLVNHQREEVQRQARENRRIYLMMMASQLTLACTTTRSSPQEVVSTFGEVYKLLESLMEGSDVAAQIEEWLRKQQNEGPEGPLAI